MATEIRHPRVDEFDALMRYVERAFGHSKGFFEAAYPHLYRPTEQAMSWAYVVAEDGEIVSHVGVYPIETVTAGVPLTVGGIGAVSTAPKARGKGYMTKLLYHVIDEMRRIGYPVSWLGGDHQRYNTFGWEIAGPVYELEFSDRALAWYNVAPVEIEEVMPAGALDTIQHMQGLQPCYTIRPDLDHHITKMDHRFFICDDGYAILCGQERNQLRIMELVSVSGNEIGMIRALLDWNFGDRASWQMSTWDTDRLGRLMPFVRWCGADHNCMLRINDLTQLLTQAQEVLAAKAAPLRDFAVSLGMREHDRTTATTVTVEDSTVDIRAGNHAETYIELSSVEMARLVLGGPPPASPERIPPSLLALLPVPCFVPPFDHV